MLEAAPKTSSKPPPTSTAEVLARLTAMDEKEKAKARLETLFEDISETQKGAKI